MADNDDGKHEHLSEHGYYHELIKNEDFVKQIIMDPKSAVASNKLDWDPRNDERLELARRRILEYAQKVLGEVSVLNFRNCIANG